MKLVIIDYGIGNTKSLINAFHKINSCSVVLSDDEEIINNSDLILIPGVGAFEKAMKELKKRDLVRIIRNYAKSNKPILGICLGMQLLFESSEEFGSNKGLGLIKGNVVRFPDTTKDKIPHVSWNNLNLISNESSFFDGIKNEYYYFVHSFICKPMNKSEILTTSNYGGVEFCSSVNKNNIYGFQFHPEKSSKFGLLMLENFINTIKKSLK